MIFRHLLINAASCAVLIAVGFIFRDTECALQPHSSRGQASSRLVQPSTVDPLEATSGALGHSRLTQTQGISQLVRGKKNYLSTTGHRVQAHEWEDAGDRWKMEMLKLLWPEISFTNGTTHSRSNETTNSLLSGNVSSDIKMGRKPSLSKLDALNIFVPSIPDQMPRVNRILFPSSFSTYSPSFIEVAKFFRSPFGSSEQNFIDSSLLPAEHRSPKNAQPHSTALNNNILDADFLSGLGTSPQESLENPPFLANSNDNPSIRVNASSIAHLLNILENPEEIESLEHSPSDNTSFASDPTRNNFRPTPVPPVINNLNSIPRKDIENDILVFRENVTRLKEYPSAVDAFTILLKNLGLPLDVANPEFDVFNPRTPLAFQTEVGAKCITSDAKEVQGVCLPLEECPALQPFAAQTEHLHATVYLYSNICRFQTRKAYYCCPLYTFSSALPGKIRSIVPPPQESPVKTDIPGPDECGRVKTRHGKVTGGDQVKDGDWPWLAALGTPESETGFRLTCSGALVTRRHVLSAAHCFYTAALLAPSHVRLGDTDLRHNSLPLHRDYVIIGRNFPQYHKHISINDIVILTLDRDVIFDEFVGPGCLPYDLLRSPAPGDNVTAVGFGRQSSRFPLTSASPNAIELRVLENSFCQQAYYSSRSFPVIDHRTFCAGGRPDQGTCEGDSGGPLHMYDAALDRHVVVGLVKGGGGCGVADLPSVNTRLVPFLPWIETVIKQRNKVQQ